MTAPHASFLAAWEAFWFRQVPPHSYALLRILFGAVGLLGILGMTPVHQFWIPGGLFAAVSNEGIRAEIVGNGLGWIVGWCLFLALVCSFAALTVGYLTNYAIVVCFVGSVLQPEWNRLPLSSAHHVIVVVLFCLLWVDGSQVWSIDAWRRGQRSSASSDPPSAEPIWPLLLIRFQVSLIYFNSGLWKLSGEQWRDGSAIHYAMALNVFQRFPADLPGAFEMFATIGTYVTLAWEIGFPVMLFHRVSRKIALVVGVMLHAGMALALELGPFSAIMIASYVAFLAPESLASWRSTARTPLHRDGRSNQCGATVTTPVDRAV